MSVLIETPVADARRRWTIEEGVKAAKSEVGPDHYVARHYHSRYRHITLHWSYWRRRRRQARPNAPTIAAV